MKKFYSITLAMVMMLASAVSASAEGIHLGYCEGKAGSTHTGYGSKNQTISAAVKITPEMLAPYASCQITSLYVNIADDAAAYPETITGWLRSDKEGANEASGTVAAQGGWLTIQFDQPVNIASYADGIWAGFEYDQPKKLNLLCFDEQDEQIDNTGWVAKNGTWSDFKRFGILPIEVIVEGESLPQHDLAITKCDIRPNVVKLGSELIVKGAIKNNATKTAKNPVVKASFEGYAASTTLNIDLAYREVANFEVAIPLSANDTTEREVNVDVEVAWSDGIADDYAVDNKAVAHASLVKEVYYRKMLVEEATGAWCGWCVRGLVGLREMRKNHPDQFIGLGIHNGDDYVVSTYDSWIGNFITGYPSCLINRNGKTYDPGYNELEAYLTDMDPISSKKIDIEASYTDQLHVTTTLNTLASEEDANYKLVYVVMEDKLPIEQSNYYSGGSYGEMGGFESMPSKTDIEVDDVVRGVYPSPTGLTGAIPAQIVKGETYSYTANFDLPTISKAENVALVVMLIDGKSGEVVNAEKCETITGLNDSTTGIETIETAKQMGKVYNLNGQCMDAAKPGLNIINGRVVFISK